MNFSIVKRRPIISVLTAVSVGFSAWYFWPSSDSATPSVRPAEKDAVAAFTGSVRSTIQGVGTATAASTQTLEFNSNGKIVRWDAKPGERVKKGQVLAEVDSADVDNDIRAQELSLRNAQLNYDKLFTSVTEYDRAKMESSIAASERSLAIFPDEMRNLEMERDAKIADQTASVEQAERSLAIAKEKLETLRSDVDYVKASSENAVVKSSTDLAYILSSSSVSAGTQLSDARAFVQAFEDSALNFDDFTSPSEFSAKDSEKGVKAQETFAIFRSSVKKYAEKLPSANFSNTGGVLEFLLERENMANSAVVAADAISLALDATIPASSMTSSTISSLSSSASGYRSKFASYLNEVASTRKQVVAIDDPALIRQSADNTVANKSQSLLEQESNVRSLEANLASAKAGLAKLESDYVLKIQQKKDSAASLEETLKANRLSYAEMLDGPTREEIQSALNQIEQAKISLSKVRKKKEDYQMIAGFDGVITSSNGKVGEISTNSNSADSATSITVEVPWLYEISVLVDQLDVVKVREGQPASIKFDSYPGETFTGTVNEVDPTPTTNQGVVSYKALIWFQSDELRLYNSMTATVTIVTEERTDAVMVPTAAISEFEGKKIVRVWKEGRPRPIEVKTGLVNGSDTEILEGIEIGDKVVSTAFSLSTAGARSNGAFSIFNPASNRSRSSGGMPGGSSGGNFRESSGGNFAR